MSRRAGGVRAATAMLVVVVGLLTGCTAQPSDVPVTGATAEPASAVQLVCPDLTEVAALTATPYSSRTAGSTGCRYATTADAIPASTVTVQRLAADDHRTAAAIRYEAIRRGAVTADLPALAFDAFAASTSTTCTVWFPSAGGVLTSVTARTDGAAGASRCTDAGAVATLIGASTAASAPTVALLAPSDLLGTATASASWPWLVGRDAGVRIDRSTSTGYLHPGTSSSFAAAAARIPTDSAAVVIVSGTAEAGASRLEVLGAATAALSAASGRAPGARLIVVGPVAAGASPTELGALQGDLRSAAAIAGAVYVDPTSAITDASAPSGSLQALAAAITAQLRTAGVQRG